MNRFVHFSGMCYLKKSGAEVFELQIYGDAAAGEVFFHLFYSVIFKYVSYLAQEVRVLGARGD